MEFSIEMERPVETYASDFLIFQILMQLQCLFLQKSVLINCTALIFLDFSQLIIKCF